jgi:glycosyltransferase involved in cell wall biosynthesis
VSPDITPLILTFNEAPNLPRTLAPLHWARDIVIVDSRSTDETAAICRANPRVRLIERDFDTHADQWNFGLDQVTTEWVLTLDADYVLTDELAAELAQLRPSDDVVAWFARFRYCIFGHPLRASLYPPRPVLFRRARCRYVQTGHTQTLRIDGGHGELAGRILHDDRKPVGRWVREQVRYMELEAQRLRATPAAGRRVGDRLRATIVLAPPVVFFYTLLGRGLILDGWPGWYYVLQRTIAESILSLLLIDHRLRSRRAVSPDCDSS